MEDADLRRSLERVDAIKGELEHIKRDLLQGRAGQPEDADLHSLHASIEGAGITVEMVHEAKRSLFDPSGDGD